MFSEKEVAFVKTQRLARIATVSAEGQPHVEPVGFDFDGLNFYVSKYRLMKTKRYAYLLKNPKVALTIDDLESVEPWVPRGMIIHGTAELTTHDGYLGAGTYFRIKPMTKWSWGIDGFQKAVRDEDKR